MRRHREGTREKTRRNAWTRRRRKHEGTSCMRRHGVAKWRHKQECMAKEECMGRHGLRTHHAPVPCIVHSHTDAQPEPQPPSPPLLPSSLSRSQPRPPARAQRRHRVTSFSSAAPRRGSPS